MHDSRTPESETSEPEAPRLPLSRAERRARGKAGKQPPPNAKGRITGHQTRGTGPRQWTNRRGGG